MININKIKILNNTSIKLIAFSIMLFNHVGIIFFPNSDIFLKIGEISFPLFAFCIAEGFHYTKNRKKYLRNLLIFALISEIFFDFAFFNKIYWLHQNVLFTMFSSVLFLMIYEKINSINQSISNKTMITNLLYILALLTTLLIFLLISTISCTDHNTYGLLLIFILYVFRDKPIIKYIFSFIILYISFGYKYSLLSIPIMMLYNGKRGLNLKYFFYLFYPLHLLILIIIRELIF